MNNYLVKEIAAKFYVMTFLVVCGTFSNKKISFSILALTVFFTGTFQLNNRIYKFLFNLRINMNFLINIAIIRKKWHEANFSA